MWYTLLNLSNKNNIFKNISIPFLIILIISRIYKHDRKIYNGQNLKPTMQKIIPWKAFVYAGEEKQVFLLALWNEQWPGVKSH